MKKFASMMMAAVMIFALAVPAFAAQTSSYAVKATMQSPKIAVTAGKVSVVANPYRIKVNNDQSQIINTPVAFVNKSDVGLSMKLVVTPTSTNNIAFRTAEDIADADQTNTVTGGYTGADGAFVAATDAVQIPCANVTVAAKFVPGEYSASQTIESWAAGDDCLVAELNGTPTVMSTTGAEPGTSETADAYTNAVDGNDASAKAITLDAPADITKGNAVWVKVTGTMSTNVDYTTWKSGGKAASLEFTVAFLMEPVANEPPAAAPAGG